MKQHLTERAIKAMVPEIDRDVLVYDDEVTGFAICICRSCKRALVHRSAAPQHRLARARLCALLPR
jgi:hypothetical protein